MTKSIIGKKYIASDNSYLINLTYPGRDVRLAGMVGENPKEAKIVSEPYMFGIRTFTDEEAVLETFINVRYKKDIIRVLYHEDNVNACLGGRIQSNFNNHRGFFLT